jgi:hypothetical protein
MAAQDTYIRQQVREMLEQCFAQLNDHTHGDNKCQIQWLADAQASITNAATILRRIDDLHFGMDGGGRSSDLPLYADGSTGFES